MSNDDWLPPATLDVARETAIEADRQLHRLARRRLPIDGEWVRRVITLPLETEDDWPAPATPIRVGHGAVHADLIPDDVPTFETLVATLHDPDPESVAAEAQAWRLPVAPYRRRAAATFDRHPIDLTVTGRRELADVRVLDLTAMWAGPLATKLLADCGAHVTKIDPAARPDGFRRRPRLYAALNAGKHVIDLDLRAEADRERFERLVASADVVIDSFSRRVMSNFGYDPHRLRALNPELTTLSITAFPWHVPEHGWISYGTGVHAVSGLGIESGSPRAPAVAYPDPLTGLRAFAAVLGLLGRAGPRPHVEVSLLGSVAPLVARQAS